MKIGKIVIDESNLKLNLLVVEIVDGIMFININTLNKIIITSTSHISAYCGNIGTLYSYYIDGNKITECELIKLMSNLYGE